MIFCQLIHGRQMFKHGRLNFIRHEDVKPKTKHRQQRVVHSMSNNIDIDNQQRNNSYELFIEIGGSWNKCTRLITIILGYLNTVLTSLGDYTRTQALFLLGNQEFLHIFNMLRMLVNLLIQVASHATPSHVELAFVEVHLCQLELL